MNYHNANNALTTYKIQKILNLNDQIVNLNLPPTNETKMTNRSPRLSRKSWFRSKNYTAQNSHRNKPFQVGAGGLQDFKDLKIDSTNRIKESDIPLMSDTKRLHTPIEEMIDDLKEMEQSMR